jgi:uncharacterized pyridoxal phosphate-containing UPF0001 family protein
MSIYNPCASPDDAGEPAVTEKYFLQKTIMSTIAANLQAVEATIGAVCAGAGRPRSTVQLLAVSKTFPAEAVLEAARRGQRAFGENYLQEGVDKIAFVAKARPELVLEWHFIGPIQSNKTRPIAASFDWVHTVERLKIAQRLSEQRPPELRPAEHLPAGEHQRRSQQERRAAGRTAGTGARRCGAAEPAPARADGDPRAAGRPGAAARRRSRACANWRRACVKAGIFVDTLSMGMSGDMRAAMLEGATIVRVGSAIFGSRHYE